MVGRVAVTGKASPCNFHDQTGLPAILSPKAGGPVFPCTWRRSSGGMTEPGSRACAHEHGTARAHLRAQTRVYQSARRRHMRVGSLPEYPLVWTPSRSSARGSCAAHGCSLRLGLDLSSACDHQPPVEVAGSSKDVVEDHGGTDRSESDADVGLLGRAEVGVPEQLLRADEAA